jgi:type I restriction enzyme R subunit
LEKHTLDQDQEERLRRDLARDYHILTADERLDRIARDVTAHFSKRWETGKAMLVAIDKITCVRMHDLITKYWADQVARQAKKIESLETDGEALQAQLTKEDEDTRVRVLAAHQAKVDTAQAKLEWLQTTEVCVVISDEQNEIKKFKEWGLDIVPHRTKVKERDLGEEFKKPDHPFRFVIVCAMWLTGFDVPSLATLYLDKPMKGHNLMQAIARANRKAKGKNNGHLVDYNGMLKSLRAALAKYGPGPGPGPGPTGPGPEDPPAEGLEELLAAFVEAILQCETHLKECGFELSKLVDAALIESGHFGKLALLGKTNEGSAVNAVCKTDETRARFEVLAREVFKKRKALVGEPELTKPYLRRANAIDAIYKKLQANKEAADITAVMMGLRGVVSKAITHQPITRLPGADSGKVFDISDIDFDKLRKEFEALPNKNTTVQSVKDAVEKKLQRMIQQNPLRMDFYERYREIIEAYNRETDRITIEKTFEELMKFVGGLTEEEQRTVKEGLDEEQLAVFDRLVHTKGDLGTKERNTVKKVAADLLEAIKAELGKLDHWKEKGQTQAQVHQLIYNYLYDENTGLPVNAYTDEEVKNLAEVVYLHVYQQYESATESVYTMVASGGGGGTVTMASVGPPSDSEGHSLSLVPDEDDEPAVLPFRRLADNEVQPFVNAIPLLDLKIAAGGLSPDQVVEDNVGDYDWVAIDAKVRPARDLFVAQVIGESMNRRIPNGAYCVWRLDPAGSRSGKVVLAQHRDIQDPETDGRFTVKVYESEKEELDDGTWRHTRITLRPSSSDPSFEPIVLKHLDGDELKVIAELVEVLGHPREGGLNGS